MDGMTINHIVSIDHGSDGTWIIHASIVSLQYRQKLQWLQQQLQQQLQHLQRLLQPPGWRWWSFFNGILMGI